QMVADVAEGKRVTAADVHVHRFVLCESGGRTQKNCESRENERVAHDAALPVDPAAPAQDADRSEWSADHHIESVKTATMQFRQQPGAPDRSPKRRSVRPSGGPWESPAKAGRHVLRRNETALDARGAIRGPLAGPLLIRLHRRRGRALALEQMGGQWDVDGTP